MTLIQFEFRFKILSAIFMGFFFSFKPLRSLLHFSYLSPYFKFSKLKYVFPLFPDALYDIITVGAPAAHFQGFKCGGLQRLLSRYEAEKKR